MLTHLAVKTRKVRYMALEQTNYFKSQPIRENQEPSKWLSSPTLDGLRALNQSGDLKPGTIPDARFSKQGDMLFCSQPLKDAPETPEQRTDRKIKDTFGAEVFDHLKDSEWLIDNRKKLEAGFSKLNKQDAWDMAKRMTDLSIVDGKPLIYFSKTEGQAAGNLREKRYDVYLRRGRFRSDDCIGQFYH